MGPGGLLFFGGLLILPGRIKLWPWLPSRCHLLAGLRRSGLSSYNQLETSISGMIKDLLAWLHLLGLVMGPLGESYDHKGLVREPRPCRAQGVLLVLTRGHVSLA